MHRRLFADLVSLAALTVMGCGTDTPSNPGNVAGSNGMTAGSAGQSGGGAANTSGNGGMATTAGTAGTPTAGANATGGAGGSGGGGATAPACKAVTPINGSGLTVSATDISAFKYAPTPSAEVTKMAYDPVGKLIVILNGETGAMYSLDPNVALPTAAMGSPLTTTQAYDSGGYQAAAGYGTGVYNPYRGIAFGADGTLYVMAARGGANVGVNIQKGAPPAAPGGPRTWSTIVSTSQGFQQSGTNYDHSFAGMAVSPDGAHLYLSSGSRTEHGETRSGSREEPLSSAIFKVPTVGTTDLKNDAAALTAFLFADGTRNGFDVEFNAAGDLIGTDNGPDMDLPDEVNFLEQGKHYGFPWRFGDVDNPTREATYSNAGDKRLRSPYAIDSYTADPQFPAAPAGALTDPIRNMGPDANYFRANKDAENPTKAGPEGLAGITGHRSPLGLAFDTAGALCGEYYKEGFLLSYGSLVTASFPDPGEDLLFIKLTKTNGTYTMNAKQIAKGIKFPMDSLLIGNKLFTLGRGDAGQIFVFVLPTP
jgi:hypothetical protein